jgi:hypothetical protein
MVTKSKKKQRIFSKKHTRKNNYYGGLGPEDEILSEPSLTGETENLSSESPEIQIPSFVDEKLYNKALASNVDTLIEQSLENNDFYYFLEEQQEKISEASNNSQLPTASGIPGMTSEIQEQRIARLEENKLKYKDKPAARQKQTGIHSISEYIDTSGRGDQSNMIYNTPSRQGTRTIGGGKYFRKLLLGDDYDVDDKTKIKTINTKKWLNIFKKYKELTNLFSSGQKDNSRRMKPPADVARTITAPDDYVIIRFNLYLEMMSFYSEVKEVLKLPNAKDNITTYYNAIPEDDKSGEGINLTDFFAICSF